MKGRWPTSMTSWLSPERPSATGRISSVGDRPSTNDDGYKSNHNYPEKEIQSDKSISFRFQLIPSH